MKISKQQLAGLLTIVMTVAFFFTLVWGIGEQRAKNLATAQLENHYQNAFYSYLDHLEGINLNAGKLQAVSGLQRALLLGEIKADAAAAAANLALLPVDHQQYQRVGLYFNQLADYSNYLASQLARGESLSEQDLASLAQIPAQTEQLQGVLREMEESVSGGATVFAGSGSADNAWSLISTAAAASGTGSGRSVYFDRLSDALAEVEELEYAGGYSAHMRSLPVKGLLNEAEVASEQALAEAEQFLSRFLADFELESASETGAQASIPVYSFIFQTEVGEYFLGISRQGGKVIQLFHGSQDGGQLSETEAAGGQAVAATAALSLEQAVAKARELLQLAGFPEMELVEQRKYDEALVLGFVRTADEVLYYPDAVSIKIDLASGLPLVFDAQQYYQNTGDREQQEPQFDVESAISGLGDLQISGHGLAYISDGAGGETLCHELRGSSASGEFRSYLNAEDGSEERISSYQSDEESFYLR